MKLLHILITIWLTGLTFVNSKYIPAAKPVKPVNNTEPVNKPVKNIETTTTTTTTTTTKTTEPSITTKTLTIISKNLSTDFNNDYISTITSQFNLTINNNLTRSTDLIKSFNNGIKPTSSIKGIIASSVQLKDRRTVDMNVTFIRQLQELDHYAANYSKFIAVCREPPQLRYCNNVILPIAKDLAIDPHFQDSMAKAAVESLIFLLNDSSISYETELKEIFCNEKFPTCHEITKQLSWRQKQTSCHSLLPKVSIESRKLLVKMRLCNQSLPNHHKIDQCIQPIKPNGKDICGNHTLVSPWLSHASIEINSLLHFQFDLNSNLTVTCRNQLADYLCFSGIQCFDTINIQSYMKEKKVKCGLVNKQCENQMLSTAIEQLFLRCKEI